MNDADDQDAYLDTVLIGGRERATIVVVDYDGGWPARYEALAVRVRGALGSRARQVEHIGSTAVPGLAAKPIIDMLLVVDDLEDEDAFIPDLVAAGFVLRVREQGHRMFRTPARDVHLHVLGPGRAEAVDYLDLRDWLRVSRTDRDLYAAEKRRLARRGWSDMNYYAEAKTAVVQAILARARAASPAAVSGIRPSSPRKT